MLSFCNFAQEVDLLRQSQNVRIEALFDVLHQIRDSESVRCIFFLLDTKVLLVVTEFGHAGFHDARQRPSVVK